MSEFEPTLDHPEANRYEALAGVIEQYCPEDKEFIIQMDFEEALGYVYGMLLEAGEDPDVVLADCGVIESEDE